jgi:hypothetical protein
VVWRESTNKVVIHQWLKDGFICNMVLSLRAPDSHAVPLVQEQKVQPFTVPGKQKVHYGAISWRIGRRGRWEMVYLSITGTKACMTASWILVCANGATSEPAQKNGINLMP